VAKCLHKVPPVSAPHSRHPTRTFVAVGIAALTISCSGERPLNRALVTPDQTRQLDPKTSPFLKAHMRDGRLFVFSTWSVDESKRVVTGTGRLLLVDRTHERRGPFQVPIADVALFETNAPARTSRTLVGLTVVTGASLALTAACLTNPKACFGSCPTFYVSDGQHPVLQAEGFSDSIAPSLEATDIDALYRARPTKRALQVRMTNEALETHVVKRVEVLTVPRPAGGRVFYATEGRLEGGFYGAGAILAADRCDAPEGSCAGVLRAFDGQERSSAADGSNLATREELTLTFPPTRAASLGVVIAARQTLLTTYLLYQGLAYLGSQATAALSELERDPSLKGNVEAAHRQLGGIEVLVPDARGRWETVGEAFETGPIATDTHLVRLPPLPPGVVRVRLRLTKGDWRLDWVSLAELGPRLEPTHLTARSISGRTDKGRLVTPRAGEPIVTLPGDAYTFDFELPPHPESLELFLSTRGYYLEWIREQWLAEESRLRAAMMLYTPSLALRVLAPDYKKQEAGMERLFWESRYAHP
jgi:hypothetical protein